jgi:hypothetical protein
LTGSNRAQDYVTPRSATGKVAALLVVSTAICGFAFLGCGGTAPSVITALDGTFSDEAVEAKCLTDLDHAASLAAEKGGSFTFFAYDGDPLSRRGISVDFGEMDVPNRLKGTEKVSEYRVEQASSVLDEMRTLAADQPEIGGTSLVGVLTRIARIAHESNPPPTYIVNCGDGIWTDLKPDMGKEEIQKLAREVPPGLEGRTIDFVGLSASTPGSGPWVEKFQPLIKQLLEEKHAHLGVYDIELPADWPEN